MKKRIINKQLLNSYSDDIKHFLKPIYASRNICETELDLSLKNLLKPDFNELPIAIKILTSALKQQQKILVIGDFDADGATACALSIKAMRVMGFIYVDFLVPNRFKHGYGLSPAIVEIAKYDKQADIIITVDNGISSHAGVTLAKKYGIQVIITDHHLPNDTLPAADAIVNPNLADCNFKSKNLAGVGVAFYLFSALKTHLKQQKYFEKNNITVPNMQQFLDLVALGTIADVVILDRNNKILVNAGLKVIKQKQCSIGILALFNIAKININKAKSTDLAFNIAPRLNAAGRLSDISRGIKCLLSIEYNDAYNYALELDEFNKNRKVIQEEMIIEAEEIISKQQLQNNNFAIVLFNKNWHEGVVGIVAGKLKETYHCPCIVFAQNANNLKGSARSIDGIHIKDLLTSIDSQYPNLIIKFGGHAMAAGLLINPKNFNKFNKIFKNSVKDILNNKLPTNELLTDGQLTLIDINLTNAKLLMNNIWGSGCTEPIFYDSFFIVEQKVLLNKHLKLRLKKEDKVFDAIAFNTAKIITINVVLAYRLSVNYYLGSESLQLMVVKLKTNN